MCIDLNNYNVNNGLSQSRKMVQDFSILRQPIVFILTLQYPFSHAY